MKLTTMIYLDNNATTCLAPEVFASMEPFLTTVYGNPSSAHALGRESRVAVESAREHVASLLGASSPDEIVFTSGGTESDNWAIRGAFAAFSNGRRHAVTTAVEHEAVHRPFENLGPDFEVTTIGVRDDGSIDPSELVAALRPDTAVVSVMMANNETGVVFPVAELAARVKESSNAFFHVDGVNAVGKIPISLDQTAIDLFSVSAHKMHGPKGIGALYIKNGCKLPALLTGGGQELSRRAGTEALHQIVGFGRAAELVGDFTKMEEVRHLRQRLENEILKIIPESRLNGTIVEDDRLPNTSNISFANTNGEMILSRLSDEGIFVSTGSACSAGNHHASSVLQAMNVPFNYIMGAIRFSLSRFTTPAEIDEVLTKLPGIVQSLRTFRV